MADTVGVGLVSGGNLPDWLHPKAAFERAPGLFDPLELLVSQHPIRWRQVVIIAMHPKCAIQWFGGALFGRVNPQEPAFGQTQ